MALTSSNPITLGVTAPQFLLFNTVTEEELSLNALKGEKGTVIMFICNHCPFVIHINEILVALANTYQQKGINFIAISSNDVENYPQDGPDKMKQLAKDLNYPFPYLYDATQDVAKAYDAACTPDFYLFDSQLKATYHGQLDTSRPGNGIPVTGIDLIKAMEAVLDKAQPLAEQKPSMGCGIKWKKD
ncbi:thioredoxin family protein [Psychroserpens sp. NJDZ02]|uniref:thioredoxin family protein n=1 Tax=Psychroserpens sp. NJDZ02 TaxID=2570561 RepID=UPI0010A7B91B|nr:thioredoxin family protein [Psychroserpens sp. NJDZ02]QCE41721.1 thioredoxin family protein [Psychroserpens sp. NJDZ02]